MLRKIPTHSHFSLVKAPQSDKAHLHETFPSPSTHLCITAPTATMYWPPRGATGHDLVIKSMHYTSNSYEPLQVGSIYGGVLKLAASV